MTQSGGVLLFRLVSHLTANKKQFHGDKKMRKNSTVKTNNLLGDFVLDNLIMVYVLNLILYLLKYAAGR